MPDKLFPPCFIFYFSLHCRHEVPVTFGTITIVHESDDLVVIDKPCSVPVRIQHCLNVYI